MHPDFQRLFALDASLRSEAEEMLARSGLGPILGNARYGAVGSYAMHTMVWRDLDFERMEEPDWARHWEVCTAVADAGWCVRLQCVDVYREAWSGAEPDFGLYLGLRVVDPLRAGSASPGDPTVWKLDLWTARPEEFAPSLDRRKTWEGLMTEETRSYVLAIKEAVCGAPEYRKTMLSVHVYEAVLEQGIRDLESFRSWWAARYEEK